MRNIFQILLSWGDEEYEANKDKFDAMIAPYIANHEEYLSKE